MARSEHSSVQARSVLMCLVLGVLLLCLGMNNEQRSAKGERQLLQRSVLDRSSPTPRAGMDEQETSASATNEQQNRAAKNSTKNELNQNETQPNLAQEITMG